jgi:hypothetical protein
MSSFFKNETSEGKIYYIKKRSKKKVTYSDEVDENVSSKDYKTPESLIQIFKYSYSQMPTQKKLLPLPKLEKNPKGILINSSTNQSDHVKHKNITNLTELNTIYNANISEIEIIETDTIPKRNILKNNFLNETNEQLTEPIEVNFKTKIINFFTTLLRTNRSTKVISIEKNKSYGREKEVDLNESIGSKTFKSTLDFNKEVRRKKPKKILKFINRKNEKRKLLFNDLIQIPQIFKIGSNITKNN